MLDVHPPHTSAHSWKDFFIHIATIVVGLLIAVGLEQTVEYLHHRSELAETRKALQGEIEANSGFAADATAEYRRFVPLLQANLKILHYLEEHPGAPAAEWPGEYRLTTFLIKFSDSRWKIALQNNTVSLMPDEEATRYADIYTRFEMLNARETDRRAALDALLGRTMEDPDPSHLSPEMLQKAIEATRDVIRAESRVARDISNMGFSHPELHLVTVPPDERQQALPLYKGPSYQKDLAAVTAVLDREYKVQTSEK